MQFLPWGRWVGGKEGGRNYNKPIFERSDVQGRGKGEGEGEGEGVVAAPY